MKNIKKLGLILVIALTFGISSVGMAAEPDYTIGITIWGGSHPWSIQACNFANYIANILNCKIVVTYHNVRPEDEINNMENYVSSKADAVISWAPSGTITPKCAEILGNAKIYYGTYDQDIPQQIKNELYKNPYYIGNIAADNNVPGYQNAEVLLKKGCKNAVVLSAEHGTVHQVRAEAFKEAFEKGGGKVLATQWDLYTAEESAKALESLIAAHPEVDCVYGTGGPYTMGAIEAVKRLNKVGKIFVTGTDISLSVLDNIKEGSAAAVSGGHWISCGLSLIRAYNVLTGNPLGSNTDDVEVKMFQIDSADAAQKYREWFIERPILTEDEIKSLVVKFNPEMNMDKFKEIAKSISIESIYQQRMKEKEEGIDFPPKYIDMGIDFQ